MSTLTVAFGSTSGDPLVDFVAVVLLMGFFILFGR